MCSIRVAVNVKLSDEETEKAIKVTADACHTVLHERYRSLFDQKEIPIDGLGSSFYMTQTNLYNQRLEILVLGSRGIVLSM